ncbi:uncharacterized protein NECHADRAFT_85649 [Fusarium vanettenii 77-13-4]|uniref:2EXR domain-containing protein n=1 Tax=Fusarium vanettenii (strain ATCC MYA-4622 / CBS 123669 / FGSC 9596 / NRRL 45880 / 77-13-4) TaxID=660122 RepID=C7ZPA3_FUSV7|nr:uncharacterized protein NECHADRAFT_85649 [Fusarium vanettenii 77-13-4]EEU34314.1 predicted protein [Fusarium vanettenii 77-13-4]
MAPSRPTTPQRRSASPASSDSSDKTVTNSPTRPRSFRMFPKLPLEVQDLIWKEVLDLDAATVHGVEIRRSTTDQPATMVRTALWNSDSGMERTEIYPIRDALHETCRRSRAAKRRENRVWRAQVPYQLESDTPWVPGQQADLSRDLFIVSNDLQEDIKESERVSGVLYAGVTWEGMWDLHVAERLEKVVDLFPDAEVIYVVVTANLTIHPHLEAWKSEKSHILEDYLRECEGTASNDTKIEFLSKDLVYREISAENLSEMGGLHEPLSYINVFYERFDLKCEEARAEAKAKAEKEAEAEEAEEVEVEGGKDVEVEVEEWRRPVIRVMTWEKSHRTYACCTTVKVHEDPARPLLTPSTSTETMRLVNLDCPQPAPGMRRIVGRPWLQDLRCNIMLDHCRQDDLPSSPHRECQQFVDLGSAAASQEPHSGSAQRVQWELGAREQAHCGGGGLGRSRRRRLGCHGDYGVPLLRILNIGLLRVIS